MSVFTHCGRLGDCLWSLATIEAFQKANPNLEPTSLYLSKYCEPLVKLLGYKYNHVEALQAWEVEFSAPVKPWQAPLEAKAESTAYHLGLRGWPSPTLLETYPRLMLQEYGVSLQIRPDEPWLLEAVTLAPPKVEEIAISFSDEYVEQKVGFLCALARAELGLPIWLYVAPTSRIVRDFWLPPEVNLMFGASLTDLANGFANAKLVVTCNSLGHPLASSLGCRTIVVEPNPMRQQAVFKAPIKRNTYLDTVNSFELISAVRAALA